MTIFKSRQVNLDPEPFLTPSGERISIPEGHLVGGNRHAPRPEFEPTRDPYPWASSVHSSSRYAANVTGDMRWMPRREQFDTPVNRVLEAFRADDAGEPLAQTAIGWLNGGSMGDGYATTDEIDHARRVLQRLANWKEQ